MLKILIVENNPTITKLLVHFFERANCSVVTAEDGLAALVALDNYHPDIIVTDIIMPKIGGDQLCRIIRKDRELKDVFLAVHSSIASEDKRKVLELDADVVIAKGTDGTYQDHVRRILHMYQNGIRRSREIVGCKGFSGEEITSELLSARRHSQIIFDNIADAVLELNHQGQIIQANKAAHKLLNKDLKYLFSSKFIDYLKGEEYGQIKEWLDSLPAEGSARFESSYETPLNILDELVTVNMVSRTDGGEVFIIVIIQVVTEQKRVENRLEKTLMEFDAVLESVDYGVLFLDKELKVNMVNRAYREMWNITEKQINEHTTLRDLLYANKETGIYEATSQDFEAYVENRIARIQKGNISNMTLARMDGKVYEYQCVNLVDEGRLLTFYDITNLKNAKDELADTLEEVKELAHRDPLTGLANLRSVREQLGLSLALAKRKGDKVAVMFMDLDGFKAVNDSFGHEAGDEILKQVAGRLLQKTRSSDTIARIGGDEFVIVQIGVNKVEDVIGVAEKIIRVVSEPYEIEVAEVQLSASIGIALYPEDGVTGQQLLKHADEAMYTIKASGKNGFTFARTGEYKIS